MTTTADSVAADGQLSLREAFAAANSDGDDSIVALGKARVRRPDVVIMDVTMPRLNGVEATRQIRAELPDVRIVGLSMHEDPGMAAAMAAAGAAACLPKTVPPVDLLAAVRGE